MQPNRKHYFARIPTIALLIIFAMNPWFGVALFILRAIDRDTEKKESAQNAYTADFRAQNTRSSAQSAADPDYIYGHDTPTEEQKQAKKRHKTVTTLCTILGAAIMLVGVFGLGDAFSAISLGDFDVAFSTLAQILGGGGALALGLRMKSTRKLERQFDKIVGDRDNIRLDELFGAAGVDLERGRSALESAIDHGYFGADAYIDNRTGTLVVRGEAPQPPKAEAQPAHAEPQPPEDKYTALLRRLREANDAISDSKMSAKVTRLEQVSARIFAAAQKDPSKEPQLKKFMDYYLPTALKLLDAYAQFSAQDVQGKNITEAKQSIERSMDMLITAFENQLDKLYQSDALDVTADIAALEGMLNLDGLMKPDFKD